MAETTRYYGKVKISKEKSDFIFSLRMLVKFIKTQDFIEITITKKRPKENR